MQAGRLEDSGRRVFFPYCPEAIWWMEAPGREGSFHNVLSRGGEVGGHRCRIFPRLWELIFTQAMPKISPKTPFLCHNFGQARQNGPR